MSKIKVLYVEDELFLGKIVKESLESRGFEVLMETDGDKVFGLFKKSEPDVCVLDVMLPNKDGFEIAEEIRGINETVPILFVTAKTQTNDVVKGFSLGGNDYIRKPFSMEELIVRIHNALRIKQENGPQKITGDSVQIGRYNFHLNRQVLNDGKQEKNYRFGSQNC
jgi:DNA-binding response OmpR family regulator